MSEIISILLWVGMWGLGGIWIARSAFTLRDNELALAGFGLGLILENWLANLMGQFIPVPLAFWLAAGLVLILGLSFSLPDLRKDWRAFLRIPIYPLQWLVLAFLAYLFFSIGRGLAMLDDFQNLPITSLIAAGDIPPHFALDPGVRFGYHYFSMLFAAQLMHIADVFVWTALDLARGLGFSLSLMLSALFVQRVTGSQLAGLIGGMMSAFAGGARWVLLLLPQGLLTRMGADLVFLGSGATTAGDLVSGLTSPWAASGMGPFDFPFAYVNGLNSTNVLLYHAGAGGMSTLIAALLLLTHNKWKDWQAWVVMSIILASIGLTNEVSLAAICLGVILVILLYFVVKRSWRLPKTLWRWLVVSFAGGLVSLFQGGVITALFLDRVSGLFSSGGAVESAYHTFSFSLFWPPKVLSSHLGYLALDNPYQILLALVEIGPILLAAPLVMVWMVKAFRYRRWYESILACAAVVSLGLFVVELRGAAGITALTRAQGLFFSLLSTFALPALWLYARHRSEKIKAWAGAFVFINIFGGVILLGISLIAALKPVDTEFIDSLDAKMTQLYWNQLDADALVFDSNPYRAPVIFGRPSNASYDWFKRKPEWLTLLDDPNPEAMHKAGYDYLYLDQNYWNGLQSTQQDALMAPCVVRVEEVRHKRLEDFRWLLDVRGCP